MTGEANDIDDLTLLATSDTHGTALNYDYFTGETFGAEDPAKTRGMENLSTAISEVRADEGAESVMLIDNGDANQGSSLETVYHANRDASTNDPIASLYNHLDYDSGTVGNHEFNCGLDDLSQYRDSLDFPLLGANLIDRNTGEPYLEPYTMVEKTTADGHTVQVAVISVVTPGVPGWAGDKVASLEFQDTVEAVKKYVPEVKAQGADGSETPGTDEPSEEAPSEDAPSDDAPAQDMPAKDNPAKPAKPAPAHGNGKAPASHGSAHDASRPAAQAAEHSQRPGGFLPRTGAEVTAIVGVALALLTAGGVLVARRRKA